jgi:hypothetical protein
MKNEIGKPIKTYVANTYDKTEQGFKQTGYLIIMKGGLVSVMQFISLN